MSKMYYAEMPDAAHDIHDLNVALLGQGFHFYTDAGVFSTPVLSGFCAGYDVAGHRLKIQIKYKICRINYIFLKIRKFEKGLDFCRRLCYYN